MTLTHLQKFKAQRMDFNVCIFFFIIKEVRGFQNGIKNVTKKKNLTAS